jgi:hypothetical protein
MAEVEVDIVVRVDGHTLVFRGSASRGPQRNRQDTGRAVRRAVQNAMEMQDTGLMATVDRYSMPEVVVADLSAHRGPTGTHVRPRPVRDAPQA